ncbi:TPA: ProQ/FINO family protein [Serratia marcescens]
MGKNTRRKEHAEVISALAERYPETISTVPHEVVPLTTEIVGEIFFDLGPLPDEYKTQIRAAIAWYMASPIYLRSVAFGEHRRNLAGNRTERPSIAEREAAREILRERGFWTKRMDMVFKVNMGRKEAANR